MSRVVPLAVALVLTAAEAVAQCAVDRVDFRTSDGGVATFTAEVVDTDETRARGLMFREAMPADHGMLFVYPEARQVSFWMRNTPLPLDIIFINRRGVVCRIAQGEPFSEAHIPSGCDAQTIFEANAGAAEAAGVTVGSPARHPDILQPVWRCE